MHTGMLTRLKIIDECRKENTNPCNVIYYTKCCKFAITPDEIKEYFIEYETGRFNQIIN